MDLRRHFAWGMAALLAAGMGCTAGKPEIKSDTDPEIAHLNKLAGWLDKYDKTHSHKGPKSLTEFQTWAKQNEGAQDGDFVFMRDHQPYTLLRVKTGPAKDKAAIYETQGDGSNMVYAIPPGGSAAGKTSLMGLQTMIGGPNMIPGMPAGFTNQTTPQRSPPPAGELPSGRLAK